jgi:hypothetical protein
VEGLDGVWNRVQDACPSGVTDDVGTGVNLRQFPVRGQLTGIREPRGVEPSEDEESDAASST